MSWIAVIAAGLGILGALLVAFHCPFAGHVVWCIGNPIWIVWGLSTGAKAIATQFTVYTILAAIGAWLWGTQWRERRRMERWRSLGTARTVGRR